MTTKISYEELETLVKAYQEGSPDAAELLVHHYRGYFRKLVNVVKDGNFNIADKTQRNFAKLFLGAAHRDNVRKFRQSDYIRKKIYKAVIDIRDRFAHIPAEDFMNELIALFLAMAMRHDGNQFHIYVAYYLPLHFFDEIWKWECDPLYDQRINFDEDQYETEAEDLIDFDMVDRRVFLVNDPSHTMYDQNWVNGYGAGEIFGSLSIYERKVLKLFYEAKTFYRKEMPGVVYNERYKLLRKTDQEIADIFGCSRKTINQKRNEAKEKIRKIAKELHLIEG